MMRVYRYQITPQSAFATPLRSDTLYGQLLCAAAELDGEAGVTTLIEQFINQQTPFVLSSAFPAGKLPLPVLPAIKRPLFRKLAKERGIELFDLLSKHKKFRKQSLLQVADFQALATQLSSRTLFLHYLSKMDDSCPTSEPDQVRKSSRTMHNSLDRISGRVLSEGGLYSDEAEYFEPGYSYDLYVKTSGKEAFERLFSHVAATGFGADASTGKGQFTFKLDESFDEAIFNHEGNALMNLSVCMADETDQFIGTYNLFTKLGKVWKGLGESNPFKKPFVAFSEGSVFSQMPDSNYVLRNIHNNPDYVQIGLPLTLPLTLEEASA